MGTLEMTEDQHNRLLHEIRYIGLHQSFHDDGEAFLEKIVDESNYENDEFIHEDPVTGIKVISRINGHRLRNIKFLASRIKEVARVNTANARLWVYFK